MKPNRQLTMLPALALLAAAPALAQSDSAAGTTAPDPGEPVFVLAPVGEDAVVSNDRDQRLGSIRDHVIERATGKVLFVAVRAAGDEPDQARLVPYSRFGWDPEAKHLVLPVTAEELATMPAYDPDAIEPGMQEGEGKQAMNASAKLGAQRLAASRILGTDLVAAEAEKPFGTLGQLVLEPKLGHIAFVLTAPESGADPHVVPWQALSWNEPDEATQRPGHFSIGLDAAAITNAPTLEGGDTKHLEKPETRQSIYRHYDVSAPVRVGQVTPDRG